MSFARSILLLLTGAAASLVLVLSCGDNLSTRADASLDAAKPPDATPACNCPAAEPPLAGRFRYVYQTSYLLANEAATVHATCPAGSTLMMGSCADNMGGVRNLTLQESGFGELPPRTWFCYFLNRGPEARTVRTTAVCLMPAP